MLVIVVIMVILFIMRKNIPLGSKSYGNYMYWVRLTSWGYKVTLVIMVIVVIMVLIKKNSIKCENYMGIRVVAHASPPGSRGLLWLYWLSRFFAKQIPLIEII